MDRNRICEATKEPGGFRGVGSAGGVHGAPLMRLLQGGTIMYGLLLLDRILRSCRGINAGDG